MMVPSINISTEEEKMFLNRFDNHDYKTYIFGSDTKGL